MRKVIIMRYVSITSIDRILTMIDGAITHCLRVSKPSQGNHSTRQIRKDDDGMVAKFLPNCIKLAGLMSNNATT